MGTVIFHTMTAQYGSTMASELMHLVVLGVNDKSKHNYVKITILEIYLLSVHFVPFKI